MLEEDHVNNDLLLKAMLVFYYFHYQPKSNCISILSRKGKLFTLIRIDHEKKQRDEKLMRLYLHCRFFLAA